MAKITKAALKATQAKSAQAIPIVNKTPHHIDSPLPKLIGENVSIAQKACRAAGYTLRIVQDLSKQPIVEGNFVTVEVEGKFPNIVIVKERLG